MTTTTSPLALRALDLRTALHLDAVVTGVNGAAYVVAAGPLGDLLGLSPALLRGAGAFLLAFAALVWLTGARRHISRAGAKAVIILNAVWALDSVAAAAAGWGSPTAAGTAWIAAQGLVVAGFAVLQGISLRRQG